MRNPPDAYEDRLLMPVARGTTHVFDKRVLPVGTVLPPVTVVPTVPCDLSVSIISVDPSLCSSCDGHVDETKEKRRRSGVYMGAVSLNRGEATRS